MKILIFEYVNGGGFAGTDLPDGLAHEGALMLKAVLNDFIACCDHELFVLLDERCLDVDLPEKVTKITVGADDNVLTVFTDAIETCDAVLPIAPETEEILWTLCSAVEKAGKHLLSSSSSAVAKTADKMKTFNILSHHHISTVPSHLLDKNPHFYSEDGTVIKERDGAGCENCFICTNEDDFERVLLSLHNPHNYLIQPFINGLALSISALFKQGTGHVLCVNRQFISIREDQRLKLDGCEVNFPIDPLPFQAIVNQLAHVFPGLWGYVGIDLIKRGEQLMIVEINPRLTSSYVGIGEALGINVAELLLDLFKGDDVKPILGKNQQVHIDLT